MAPASFTTCPSCTLGLIPLSQITIFLATTLQSKVPSKHKELGSGQVELLQIHTINLLSSFISKQ
ncbi:hypothetical protein C1H46_040631 [Malus baccata]|uniref:Uncharacterized protein n=1 Tax=Malus baccata TaxID=106549 RepID=A0A540KHX9_MALBA|nr:hypothetical protein C1H46_040631 [Malus baccata]